MFKYTFIISNKIDKNFHNQLIDKIHTLTSRLISYFSSFIKCLEISNV